MRHMELRSRNNGKLVQACTEKQCMSVQEQIAWRPLAIASVGEPPDLSLPPANPNQAVQKTKYKKLVLSVSCMALTESAVVRKEVDNRSSQWRGLRLVVCPEANTRRR